MVLNPTPIPSVQHVGDNSKADAEHGGNVLDGRGGPQAPNLTCDVFRDFSPLVVCAARLFAVSLHIGAVLFVRAPSQVGWVIVRAIAVVVANLMRACWRGAVKCFANAPVYREWFSALSVVGVEYHVAMRLHAGLNHRAAADLSDIAKIADFVGPTGDASPFFGRCVHA